jgi:hypothetical protein
LDDDPPTSPQAVVYASDTHLIANYDTVFISIFDVFAVLTFVRAFSSAQLSMAADRSPDTGLLCFGTLLQTQIREYKEDQRPSSAAFFSAINHFNLLVWSDPTQALSRWLQCGIAYSSGIMLLQ